MKAKSPKKGSSSLATKDVFDTEKALPIDVYNKYNVAKQKIDLLIPICEQYQMEQISIDEMKEQAFATIPELKDFIEYVCDYITSDLFNKDSFIDVLYSYSVAFFVTYSDNIECVVNNIHNRAFNLAVNDAKSGGYSNLDSYLSYVEKYLSTLTPKLSNIKECIIEYQKA